MNKKKAKSQTDSERNPESTMSKPRDTHLDKVCDTCGDSGYDDMLLACSRCTMERHRYCMWATDMFIEEWICEECLSKNGDADSLKPGEAECVHDSRKVSFYLKRQVPCKRNRAVETGKVKFLPTEEVIRLSSTSPQKGFPLNSNFRSNRLPKFIEPLSKRTVTASKAIGPSTNVRLRPNPSFLQFGSVSPPRRGAVHINSSTTQHSVKKPQESGGENFHDTAKPEIVNVAEREPSNIPLKVPHCRSHLPAVDTAWKGGFKFLGTASHGEFYGGLLARPPCTVHRKAFEFSKKMPQVLKVNLLNQHHLQADLFQNGCLDLCDIALYFSPEDYTKSSHYLQLLQLMETENSVLTSYIDGVELFMFTSKQLHVDAQDTFTTSNADFLCGVFRRAKYNPMKVYQKIHPLPSGSQYIHDDAANVDNNEVVDMDIDMVGGVYLGSPDRVVSNQTIPRFNVSPSAAPVKSH